MLSDSLSSQWHPAQSKIPSQQAGLDSRGNPLNGLADGTVYNMNELLRAHPENFNNLLIVFSFTNFVRKCLDPHIGNEEYLYIWMYIC